ncbi:unnamed protein product [Diamesa hyperborea]
MQPNKVADADDRVVVVDSELDEAVEKFLHALLDKFVKSWYQTVSHEEEFICSIRREFVEATQLLALRFRRVNFSKLIIDKLMEVLLNHVHFLQQQVVINKTSIENIVQLNFPVHPATRSRAKELDYLRNVSNVLVPLLFPHSKCPTYFALLRELFTIELLLPVSDLISDPNIYHLLIVSVTNPHKNEATAAVTNPSKSTKVNFLENFGQPESASNDIEKKFSVCYGDTAIYAVPSNFDMLLDYKTLNNLPMNYKNKSHVDGIEATELDLPTVLGDWTDQPGSMKDSHDFIHKLKRDRGQNVDKELIIALTNSIEQVTEIGIDVASEQLKPPQAKKVKHQDLYGDMFNDNNRSVSVEKKDWTRKKCFIFIFNSILKAPRILTRCVLSFCQLFMTNELIYKLVDKQFVDKVINQKLITQLFTDLQVKLFDPKPVASNVNEADELLRRKVLAHERLERLSSGLGDIVDVYIANPSMNKHLTFCLIDLLLTEAFPEIKN